MAIEALSHETAGQVDIDKIHAEFHENKNSFKGTVAVTTMVAYIKFLENLRAEYKAEQTGYCNENQILEQEAEQLREEIHDLRQGAVTLSEKSEDYIRTIHEQKDEIDEFQKALYECLVMFAPGKNITYEQYFFRLKYIHLVKTKGGGDEHQTSS